jgi:hypothetical protein
MRRYAWTAALLLLAMPATPIHAQASVAGTWLTEFDIGIRNENGVETSMGKRQATMTLTLKGDSVLGTWQVAAVSDAPAPGPIKLRGIRSGAKVSLEADPVERTVRMNDDEQRLQMTSTYTFDLRGDELVGTTRNTFSDHSFDGPERSFSAKRAKN